MSRDTSEDSRDIAWVSVATPFSRRELRPFLVDIERLYRINPMLVFESWEQASPDNFHLKAQNLSNGKELETGLKIESSPDSTTVHYSDGLRQSTCFRIEDGEDGLAKLVITDDYSAIDEKEREARIDEVDNSLTTWGNALFRYFHQWKQWSWLPGWKYYMQKIWQPMKPSARRITFMILVITLTEIVLFFMVFTVFWLELDKYLD